MYQLKKMLLCFSLIFIGQLSPCLAGRKHLMQVSGTVTDSVGCLISGAQITLVTQKGRLRYLSTTDQNGHFRFSIHARLFTKLMINCNSHYTYTEPMRLQDLQNIRKIILRGDILNISRHYTMVVQCYSQKAEDLLLKNKLNNMRQQLERSLLHPAELQSDGSLRIPLAE